MAVVLRHPRSLLREHRSLHHTLNRLDALLNHPPDGERRTEWLADLSSRLKELRPGLAEHFGAEEESGLFEEIETQSPAMTPASRRLLAEHGALLRSIDDLVDTIPAVPPYDIPFHSLRARARAFTKELAEHESRENEILMRALDDDSGALD
ncbi:MAG: hemerythrin domain-containing protein [Acidobacteria bacterium]|nr:hemerythrin domain-containing protein [Acidobacteriota bacterium]